MESKMDTPKSIRRITAHLAKSTHTWPLYFCCLITLLFSSSANAEWVEWVFDASQRFEWNNNINRSAFADDSEEDMTTTTNISMGRFNQLTPTLRIRTTFDLKQEFHENYDELDRFEWGASVSARKKFGVGRMRPWLSTFLSARELNVHDDQRDGEFYTGGFLFGKTLSDRTDFFIRAEYQKRDGDKGPSADPALDSDVFDQERFVGTVGFSFIITPSLLVSGSYEYMDGEIDSACTVPNVIIVGMNEELNAITTDPVFGGCIYRLDADSNSLSADMSYAFDGHTSINLGYRYQKGEASKLEYKNNIINLSVNYSY